VPLQRVEELSTHLVRLRRGDQNAQWLQIQRQWVNLASQKHQDRLAAQKSKYDQFLNPRPHDGGFTKETIAKIAEDLNLF
jgi:hypothetical protein